MKVKLSISSHPIPTYFVVEKGNKVITLHCIKILRHVTSSWLLGNALVMPSLVLFYCLRCYRSRHNTQVDTTDALPSNQDDVTCQSIFMQCSNEIRYSAGVVILRMKAFYDFIMFPRYLWINPRTLHSNLSKIRWFGKLYAHSNN